MVGLTLVFSKTRVKAKSWMANTHMSRSWNQVDLEGLRCFLSVGYTVAIPGYSASEWGLLLWWKLSQCFFLYFSQSDPWLCQPGPLYQMSFSTNEPLSWYGCHLLSSAWVCLPWRACGQLSLCFGLISTSIMLNYGPTLPREEGSRSGPQTPNVTSSC